MKVKIEFTVNVDPDKWANEFFITREAVRADVQMVARSHMHDYITSLGLAPKDEGRE